METKYTKYEWKLEYPLIGDFIIHADGLKIASIHLIDDNLEEQEANVKLMFAAREILEALIEARQMIYEFSSIKEFHTIEEMDENAEKDGVWYKIKEAIKKATQ